MLILVMGVSGVGKTAVGRALAERLGWAFLDADDDHPPENVAKMRAGIPLDDADRMPWLAAVRARAEAHLARGEHVVLACSALKRSYRSYLEDVDTRVAFVHLDAPAELIGQRIRGREGHFMPEDLLESQFDALEHADQALMVDAAAPLEDVVEAIVVGLGLDDGEGGTGITRRRRASLRSRKTDERSPE